MHWRCNFFSSELFRCGLWTTIAYRVAGAEAGPESNADGYGFHSKLSRRDERVAWNSVDNLGEVTCIWEVSHNLEIERCIMSAVCKQCVSSFLFCFQRPCSMSANSVVLLKLCPCLLFSSGCLRWDSCFACSISQLPIKSGSNLCIACQLPSLDCQSSNSYHWLQRCAMVQQSAFIKIRDEQRRCKCCLHAAIFFEKPPASMFFKWKRGSNPSQTVCWIKNPTILNCDKVPSYSRKPDSPTCMISMQHCAQFLGSCF